MFRGLALLLLCLLAAPPAAAEQWVAFDPGPGFPVAENGRAARVVTDPGDHAVVNIAAHDLREDVARVSGARPAANGPEIWAGTLGRNAAIDRLAREGRIDVGRLRGAWESFLIAAVDRPAPGVPQALVIVGSDRRGTAYGIYDLSRAIGVSPWHWWADVTPERRATLRVLPGTRRFGPPSVRYRGIFLNDEDWGLVPWAALTHAPDEKPLGPKTYERVFELLLRLKANLLWPAMHKVTTPFNANPENARLADRYAIVMGSSHAEPMLRNNVGEWTAPGEAFNYLTNAEGVREYWRERVEANAGFENIWTLGMRGIHDSGMVGPKTVEERKAALERIFADQRAMLSHHVSESLERVPQVFTPYKEVLDIYRAGLKVPEDVTLMWPDDNFGYIRHFPDAAERARKGGSGVYYHLSYLGAPLSYLWLSSTPPALIREEIGRAWDLGARRMWVANVGDIKPAELATEYFLSLAWDVEGTRSQPVDSFVRSWAAENIDAAQAPAIARILAEHHRLNFARRPEHLQWWLPGQKARPSALSPGEVGERLRDFAANSAALDRVADAIPARRRDAFFELVAYPVEAAAAANTRVFAAEAHDRLRDRDMAEARAWGARAHAADARIAELTHRYNREVVAGKWRGIMAVEPADGQWKSFRITPPVLPAIEGPTGQPTGSLASEPDSAIEIEAENATGNWRRVDGIGRNGSALASRTDGLSRAEIAFRLPPGSWAMEVELLPAYPDKEGDPLALSLVVDGRVIPLKIQRDTGNAAWSAAVLDNRIVLPVPGVLAGGRHRVVLLAQGGGVIVDRFRLVQAPK